MIYNCQTSRRPSHAIRNMRPFSAGLSLLKDTEWQVIVSLRHNYLPFSVLQIYYTSDINIQFSLSYIRFNILFGDHCMIILPQHAWACSQ